MTIGRWIESTRSTVRSSHGLIDCSPETGVVGVMGVVGTAGISTPWGSGGEVGSIEDP